MENKHFNAIQESVKALFDEAKGVLNEIEFLIADIKEVDLDNTSPLVELIARLTKTARKHELETPMKFNDNYRPSNIGTNHNGLGYTDTYSSQLTPLNSNSRYSNRQRDENQIRQILFNDDAVNELTTIIKKSNQKSFLNVIKILKKYGLKHSFGNFKDDELNKFSLKLDEQYSLIFDLSIGYEIRIGFKDRTISYGRGEEEIKLSVEDGKITQNFSTEKNRYLGDISKKVFNNLEVADLRIICLMVEKQKDLISLIKSKRDALNSVRKAYQNEPNELNELLQPLLALEKI